MKLLNYSTRYFAIILFVLLSAWAVIFYFEMLDEIYDSMDDGLENQKMLVIRQSLSDSTVLKKAEFGDGYYTVRATELDQIKNFTDSYRDTLMYMENEKEYEPVRLLETAFEHNGQYYKLKVITSMVEEDDLIEDLFYSMLWLYLGLIISILVLNNIILKKIWKPFYRLLSRLQHFRIESENKIELETTNIEEFSKLNESIEVLIDKSVASFREQKHFIENASHELQTPLAISINKLELLLENNQLEEEQLQVIASVLNNLERLTRFNKSLLLLSKIENKQFLEAENIDFNELVKKVVSDFKDLADHRNIQIQISEKDRLSYKMNRDLSVMLLSNFVKNALIHGTKGGQVKIIITSEKIEVQNSGEVALDKEKLFSRFQKINQDKRSTGLGLAISKAIAEKYKIRLEYHFSEGHVFQILFPKKD